MSYGGWSNFVVENSVQVGAVAAATVLQLPTGNALLDGMIVGVCTDLAYNGVRNFEAGRIVTQAGVGATSALAITVGRTFMGV